MQALNKDELFAWIADHALALTSTAYQNPFTHSTWLTHYTEQVFRNDVAVYALSSADQQCHLLLQQQTTADGEPLSARCLQSYRNYYDSLFSPLICSQGPTFVQARQIVDQIVEHKLSIDYLHLLPLDSNNLATKVLQQAFREKGFYVRDYFCFGNWYLPCEGLSFSHYMKQRDSQLQNTWKRKAKKFQALPGARLEMIVDSDNVERACDAFDAVYAKSWKKPEPYPHFIRGWARACAANGFLRFGIAWLDNTPTAVQFWFVMHQRAYIYRLAYDEEHASLSAGTILNAFMFEHVLDKDKVIEVDYLTGDDPYKKNWMSHRRERVGFIACNRRTMKGALMALKEWLGSCIKQWKKADRKRER